MDTTAVIHSSTPDLTTRPNASYGELVDFWNNNQTKVADLESALAIEKQYCSSHYDRYKSLLVQVDSFMETLVEYIKSNDLDKEVAADLAECFGRELTRKVYGRIRIEGDVDFVIPLDLDLDDIAQELDIHIGEAYNSDVKVEYSDVSLVEVKEK